MKVVSPSTMRAMDQTVINNYRYLESSDGECW